jgi:hypothetical protein
MGRAERVSPAWGPAFVRDGAILAGVTLTAVAATALAVSALGLGDEARGAFSLTLPVPQGSGGDAVDIAVNNMRVTVLPLGAALLVSWYRRARRTLDALLIILLAINVALVGVALGGYGWRLADALAWHGPLEAAGFAIAGAAYTAARRSPLGYRPLAWHAGCSWVMLAAAATLEVRGPLT